MKATAEADSREVPQARGDGPQAQGDLGAGEAGLGLWLQARPGQFKFRAFFFFFSKDPSVRVCMKHRRDRCVLCAVASPRSNPCLETRRAATVSSYDRCLVGLSCQLNSPNEIS